MNTKLHIGFKGKNNASYILVKSISTDSYLLTNSFEGLKRDIENLDYSYDCVILFGIDKNLVNAVRIEKVAEKETKEYSLLNLEDLSAQLMLLAYLIFYLICQHIICVTPHTGIYCVNSMEMLCLFISPQSKILTKIL